MDVLYILKSSNDTSRFLTLVFASLFLISLGMIAHNAFADRVTDTIHVGTHPYDTAVNPRTNTIYVTTEGPCCTFPGMVSVINGTTNAVTATIPVGSFPYGLAVIPDTNKIYIVNFKDNSVSVIRGATSSVVATITSLNGPTTIGANPITNEIYVANSGNNTISVINGSTNHVIKWIPVGNIPSGVGVDPKTDMIYVCGYAGTVTVISGSTNSIVTTIPVGSLPIGVGVNPDTDKIYVANANSNTVSVIDGTTNTVTNTIPVGNAPYGIAVNPVTDKIYAGNKNDSSVSVISGATNTVTGTITGIEADAFMSANPNTNEIYVANYYRAAVTVIDGNSSNISTAPSAPQNLVASGNNAQVSLAWTAPSSNGGSAITGYNVYRGTSSGTESLLTSVSASATSYTDTSATGGVTYYYYVIAINSVGASSPSNEVSATPKSASGGIALNHVQSTSGTTSSSNQMTLSDFNAGTGSNQLLVVGISANNNNAVSVTFNGTSLTQAVSSFYNNDAEFWYLINPSGTGNIVVTMAGSTQAVVGAYSFSGVDQVSPVATTAKIYNTAVSSPSISLTTKYTNDLILDLPSIWGGETLGSPTCTQQWNVNVPDAITGASSSTMVQSPGTVTCDWTASSADLWDDVAVELKAS